MRQVINDNRCKMFTLLTPFAYDTFRGHNVDQIIRHLDTDLTFVNVGVSYGTPLYCLILYLD